MPHFGLLTNPSNEILHEIKNILLLDFEFVEIAMEGPEGSPQIIIDKQFAILKLLEKFKHKPIGHTVPWMDLGSDYEYIRQAWILESMRNIRTATQLGIGLINFHTHLNGAMFTGEKRKILLDNWIKSLREIVRYADSHKIRVMLENVPVSKGIHKLEEFKYLIENVDGVFVHLDIPHAFTSGGMQAVIEYIHVFGNKISHIHWHDNNGTRDEHLPVGLGLIDHQRVVKELKSMNYDRTITLEVFTSTADAKSSANALKNLWGEN
jgi:sugar phosphate isomerase/epimerase